MCYFQCLYFIPAFHHFSEPSIKKGWCFELLYEVDYCLSVLAFSAGPLARTKTLHNISRHITFVIIEL